MFAVAGASLALWALLAGLDRLAVICALAFFAALGFGVAGAVEAGWWLSGDSDRRENDDHAGW